MGKFKKLIQSSKSDLEDSAEVIMSSGFPIILLNMVFGLLPITLRGPRLFHATCSISTIYSITLLIAMGALSLVFLQIPKALGQEISNGYKGGVADKISTLILGGAHVCGFGILCILAHRIARRLPKIYDSLVACFHLAVVEEHGKNWRKISGLKRFCNMSFLIYTFVILSFTVNTTVNSRLSVLIHFSTEFTPLTDPKFAFAVFLGYIIWELVALSHIAVCLLLDFCLQVITLCLKSSNGILQEALEVANFDDSENSESFAKLGPAQREARIELHLNEAFKKITRVHSLTKKITLGLSTAFGLSMIIEVLVLLSNTLVNLYFIVNNLMDDNETYAAWTYYELTVNFLYHFYFFFHLASSATKMSLKPLEVMEGTQYGFTSTKIKEKVQSFKSDLAAVRINLSAADYFQIDRRLISSLVGAVTTYIVVMLQFKYSEVREGPPTNDTIVPDPRPHLQSAFKF